MFVDRELVDTASTSNVSVVPLPAALPLYVGGLAGLTGLARLRRHLMH